MNTGTFYLIRAIVLTPLFDCGNIFNKEQHPMSIDDLKKQFIVNEDVLKSRLEPVVTKALTHCRIDKDGRVEIRSTRLSGKDQVKLTLAARVIGAEMDRARGRDAIEDKFAQSPRLGIYRALPHKVEQFLDSLPAAQTSKR
jgi:hypothetical protein